MMFAGLTSAYIVKKNGGNWLVFQMPSSFSLSTFLLVVSSFTVHIASISMREKRMDKYRLYLLMTVFLGVCFIGLQFIGFKQLANQNIALFGLNSNPAASFLGIMVGLHFLHVFGGIIAIIFILYKLYFTYKKSYTYMPIKLVTTYWHFVDILWIYLFIFFKLI